MLPDRGTGGQGSCSAEAVRGYTHSTITSLRCPRREHLAEAFYCPCPLQAVCHACLFSGRGRGGVSTDTSAVRVAGSRGLDDGLEHEHEHGLGTVPSARPYRCTVAVYIQFPQALGRVTTAQVGGLERRIWSRRQWDAHPAIVTYISSHAKTARACRSVERTCPTLIPDRRDVHDLKDNCQIASLAVWATRVTSD